MLTARTRGGDRGEDARAAVKKAPGDERRSARANVLLAGFIESEQVCVPVRIRDLSEHGALVVGKVRLAVDTHVTLRCNGKAIQCWIAWTADAHAGIQFGATERSDGLLPNSKLSSQAITKD